MSDPGIGTTTTDLLGHYYVEESGIQFYLDLKETSEFSAIPVVIVTAVTGYGVDPDGLKKFLSTRKHIPPPEGYFSKPIDKSEFIAGIKQILQ